MSRPSQGARISVPAVVAAAVSLLVGSIAVGLRVPGLGLLMPFPQAGRLDYSAAPPGGFAPLDSALVSRLLGNSGGGATTTAANGRLDHQSGGGLSLPAPVLVAHPFTNDDFAEAYAIPSVPFTAETETTGATGEAGEPESCSALGGKSAWYAFHATRDVGLLAATYGSDYATALTVYRGSRLGDLTRVGACSTDPRGNALVAFPAKAATTYFFQIDGPIGGHLVFTLEQQGVTTLASRATDGSQADGTTWFPVLSADGRRVLFSSSSANFAENRVVCRPPVPSIDTCDHFPLFMRDRSLHRTTKLYEPPSVGGAVGQGWSAYAGTMSVDGRYVSLWTMWSWQAPNVASASPTSPIRTEVFRHDNLTGYDRRVSVPCPRCRGDDTDGSSVRTQLSGDGRYVAFGSEASNLVIDDLNGVRDVFVRDMDRGVTTRVSLPMGCDSAKPGCEPNDNASAQSGEKGSDLLSISRDGRYVVFKSAASNLVPVDTNGVVDVFVRDLANGTTERVNLSSSGEQANADTKSLTTKGSNTISSDGRYVFFNSDATNLVPGTIAAENIYRRDRLLGKTELVTMSSSGEPANKAVVDPVHDPYTLYIDLAAELLLSEPNLSPFAFSATPDGRHVVFGSTADNLVPGDDNGFADVFLRDMVTGTTTRVSVSSLGEASKDGACNAPTISDDARFAAFHCLGSGLVEGDNNENFDVFVRELPGTHPLSGWF